VTHTTNETCPCDPFVMVVCPECGGEGPCWRCEKGLIPYVPFRDGEFADTIVIHRDS